MDTSRPSELLTISNAILGKGQLSLAKYLLIANEADNPDIHDIPKFFSHLLERINWTRDVHFQTETSIDTLDYSSKDLNVGSKVVWACTGDIIKKLSGKLDSNLFPLVIVCDDPTFISKDFNNFLWATFTRSNPSHDIYGIDAKTEFKHWGCKGALVIDARFKAHNAPPLLENSGVTKNVDKILSEIKSKN